MQTEKNTKQPLIVVVAGANGHLGQKIVAHLVELQLQPKALVRAGGKTPVVIPGADIAIVDYNNRQSLVDACRGAHCVVSALSGLKEVILDAQTSLLNAAVEAGVKRFIPSDYCIDYTKLPDGSNRNLDLRREFQHRLDVAPIAATSILNGMFTDLLIEEAPLIQFNWKRVLYWGDADQLLDFTTLEDTAAFTAKAAADDDTPRFLRIAGDTLSSKGLQQSATRAVGQSFKRTRVGGTGLLKAMIAVTKTILPKPKEVFPPWQGMQYMLNMYTGLPKLHPLDNDRYPGMQWTSVEEVLKRRGG
ncbi:MAG: NmrA family NAD(P)-binding protein [Bacteroidota bacterium]